MPGLFGFQTAGSRLEQRMDRLESGVQAEEAVRAVKWLQNTYGHYLTAGLWNDLADLFTENAVGQFQTSTVQGRANLRKHLMEEARRASLGLARGQLHTHLILQPIVTLGPDGKMAKGTWHEMAMLGKFESSASWRGGIYENEYTLEGGVWKISRLRYFQQYSGCVRRLGAQSPAQVGYPLSLRSRACWSNDSSERAAACPVLPQGTCCRSLGPARSASATIERRNTGAKPAAQLWLLPGPQNVGRRSGSFRG